MNHSIWLSNDQEKQLKVYREHRRAERGGKVIQVKTAIAELLSKAMKGIDPTKASVNVLELQIRVEALETALKELLEIAKEI